MRKKLFFLSWIYLSFINLKFSEGTCTFPSEISGVWVSSHKGSLTFNSTHVTGYPIYMSALVQSLDFECYINSGFIYVLRSTETALVFGQYIRGYLCIELNRISAYKYYYYLGTTISATNNDYIFGRVDSVTVGTTEACNRATPYEEGTFVMLVQNGATDAGNAEATCASDLTYSFSSVTITDYSGGSSCSGTTLDGCTDPEDLAYTYAACTSGMVFSSGGYFICMRSVTSGSYTYLSIRNNDTSVDGTSTYRFTCVVVQKSGNTVYATEYPNFCSDTSQTATSVSSPGIIMTMTPVSGSCTTTVVDAAYIMFIVTIIICFIFIAGVVVLFIILKALGVKPPKCTCLETCQKLFKSKTGSLNAEVPKEGKDKKKSGKIDVVNRTVFRLDSMNTPPEWHYTKRHIGPIVEPKLVPLPKVEPLYVINPNKDRKLSRTSSLLSAFSLKFKL